MKSKNIYTLPVKKSSILVPYDYEKLSFNSHEGDLQYALDFLVPEKTMVLAALAGEIVYVKIDSNIGGPDKKFWNDGNRIVIKHVNGEYSAYEHLCQHGSLVYPGQKVLTREPIGYSGNTGCSSAPHLHLEVFDHPTEDETEGITLEINFENDLRFEPGKVITQKTFHKDTDI